MSEYGLKFGSVSAMEKDRKNWLDFFEEFYNDDGELVAFSKEVYEHGFDFEDYYKFKYKLCISAIAMNNFLADDEEGHNDIHIELSIVPLPEYLNAEVKDGIADCMGTEEIDVYDIYSYGGCPRLDHDTLTLNDDAAFYDITANEDAVRMLDACATVCESINNLRGFYLDRAWNLIGSTGWDLLDNLINGKDFIQSAMDRYKDIQGA